MAIALKSPRNRLFGALMVLLLTAGGLQVGFATASNAALPAVHVVAPNGDDNGPGTEAQPWRSLGQALQRVQPGTVLLIRAGEYSGNFVIDDKQASAGAPILVSGYPGEYPVIHASEWYGLLIRNSSHIWVRNLDLVGGAATRQGNENGIGIDNSHHVVIEGNQIHHFGGGGIAAGGSNHLTVRSNRLYNNAWWNPNQSSAISLWRMNNIGGGNGADGYSNHIVGNVAYGNENRVGAISDGNCIILDSNNETGYTASTLIANNYCRGNGGRGVNIAWSSNALVVNNTLADNLRNMPQFEGELSSIESSNITFRNNLVAPSMPGAANHVYASSNVTFDHNAYVDGSAEQMGPGDQLVPGTPLFLGLFPPLESSVLDAGNGDGAPGDDFFGQPRRGPHDIGAFELR